MAKVKMVICDLCARAIGDEQEEMHKVRMVSPKPDLKVKSHNWEVCSLCFEKLEKRALALINKPNEKFFIKANLSKDILDKRRITLVSKRKREEREKNNPHFKEDMMA